jgi:hypothetical protein
MSINEIAFLSNAKRSYVLSYDKNRFKDLVLPSMIFKHAVLFGVCFHRDEVLKHITN